MRVYIHGIALNVCIGLLGGKFGVLHIVIPLDHGYIMVYLLCYAIGRRRQDIRLCMIGVCSPKKRTINYFVLI